MHWHRLLNWTQERNSLSLVVLNMMIPNCRIVHLWVHLDAKRSKYACERQTLFRKHERELLESCFFPKTRLHQMLVVRPLTIVAFLVQFLTLSFPAFVLFSALGEIGMAFQVGYKNCK